MDPLALVVGAAFAVFVALILAASALPWRCPVCRGSRRDAVDGSCLDCGYTSWI